MLRKDLTSNGLQSLLVWGLILEILGGLRVVGGLAAVEAPFVLLLLGWGAVVAGAWITFVSVVGFGVRKGIHAAGVEGLLSAK